MKIIKRHIINYTEYFLIGILALVAIVHYAGLLDMKMYFSGILLLLVCVYISLVITEKKGDERDEFIKAKTDRYLYLFINILLSIYVLFGILFHFDNTLATALLGIITLAKIIIGKFLQNKN